MRKKILTPKAIFFQLVKLYLRLFQNILNRPVKVLNLGRLGATLFDLGGLQDELESLLGIHVDLLTPTDLPPKFRAKVLAEAQPV